MKEAFGIVVANTKWKRDMDTKKRDRKSRLKPLEVCGRVLVTIFHEREGSGKMRAFWKQKVYKILEKKDEDGSVYAGQEESNSTRTREAKRKNTKE